jgi:hypothetical protein
MLFKSLTALDKAATLINSIRAALQPIFSALLFLPGIFIPFFPEIPRAENGSLRRTFSNFFYPSRPGRVALLPKHRAQNVCGRKVDSSLSFLRARKNVEVKMEF